MLAQSSRRDGVTGTGSVMGGGPGGAAQVLPAPPAGALLIGSLGKDYVLEALQSKGPDRTVSELQQHRGLQQPLCNPLLGLLDQLHITRLEAHRHVLGRAKSLLLSKVHALKAAERAAEGAGGGSSAGVLSSGDRAAAALEELLAGSFPYLGIADLEEVPLEVMNAMAQVPTPFLKQLAEDREVFDKLPAKVKQQVWEFDKTLLQTDAIPYIAAYKYEMAAIMDALNMHRFVEPHTPNTAAGTAAASAAAGSTTASPGGFSVTQRTAQMTTQFAQIAQNPRVLGKLPPTGAGRGRGGRGGSYNLKPPPMADRRRMRTGSNAIRRLKQMVGDSAKIYAHVLELCVVKYRDSATYYTGPKEASYCALRTQLVMALHDDQVSARFKDRCHELAWTLDAVIHRKAITDQHLAKLREFFAPHAAAGQRRAKRLAAKRSRGSGEGDGGPDRKRSRTSELDVGESTGHGDGAEPAADKVLAEAGMVLRDPPAMHLLASEVVNELHAAVAACQLPCERPSLGFLLQLMQLAVGAKEMLRESTFYFPVEDEHALGELWAILAGILADAELDGADASSQERERPFGSQAGWQLLLGALARDEVVRKVVQTLILERLSSADLVTSRLLLTALRDAQHWTFKQALPEYAPFAYSLADLLEDYVRSERLMPGSGFWRLAVEEVLLPLVDSDGQVHSEVLRLLLSVAKKVPAATMAAHLEGMVIATRGSRERARSQKAKYAQIAAQYMEEVGSSSMPGYIGTGGATSEWSDGFNAVRSLKYGTSESFYNVYRQIINITPGLRDIVPDRVAEFLRESDEEKAREAAERAMTGAEYDDEDRRG